ncbi:MAG: NAD(P)/FAD-dependent oxidoreductase [Bacteroidetes bacterium]|nr:NAD(P)/FAD-dependent oxidoreductase [Bacteroidota bacterium]
MEEKKVVIIGAGIAGLSAGCYLQMNGYRTEIFEMHSLPGGFCTSWERDNYIIDGCIHWLVGSSPNDPLYNLWNELVDMKKIHFIDPDLFMRVEDDQGHYIDFFADIDKLEKELLDKAPEDKKFIKTYCRSIRRFTKFNVPSEKTEELYNFSDMLKMTFKVMPYIGDLMKWERISINDLLPEIKNPLLQKTFKHLFVNEMSVIFLIFTSAWLHKKTAGYPVGGSLNFSKHIEKRFLELGGKIHYNQKVSKILTEGNGKTDKASGIQLKSGETHSADIVISAADGHYTIFEMLEGKYIDKTIKGYYDNYLPFSSYVQVALGVARTFEDTPDCIVIPAQKPIVIDENHTADTVDARIFHFDPTLAPAGKTVIIALFPTYNYQYWVELKARDLIKYKEEKNRIAKEVIEVLDARFGSVKDKLEMIDVSTPSTVIRYTNNWRGSFEGWVLTPHLGFRGLKKTLPGLDNFYMAGHWVIPGGGLPAALMSGRGVTQIICKTDGKKFKTESFG